jgi:hypothetical protein
MKSLDYTHFHLLRATTLLQNQFGTQNISATELMETTQILQALYRENQRLIKALNQNREEYYRHVALFRKEYHKQQKQLRTK